MYEFKNHLKNIENGAIVQGDWKQLLFETDYRIVNSSIYGSKRRYYHNRLVKWSTPSKIINVPDEKITRDDHMKMMCNHTKYDQDHVRTFAGSWTDSNPATCSICGAKFITIPLNYLIGIMYIGYGIIPLYIKRRILKSVYTPYRSNEDQKEIDELIYETDKNDEIKIDRFIYKYIEKYLKETGGMYDALFAINLDGFEINNMRDIKARR